MPQLLHDTHTAPTAETDGPAGDHQVVVEGRTAEEALAEVHRVHGDDARILRAEKVVKGGVGGFFAKELVQLTVEPGGGASQAATSTASAPAATPLPGLQPAADPFADETFGELLDRTTGSGRGLSSVVAELAAATNHRESTFGDALRTAMGDTSDTRPASPAATSPATADAVAHEPGGRRPRATVGATALADAAPRVAAMPTDQAPAEPEPEVDRTADAEARLDAAVRAVQAGTTASHVVRAAEQGGVTGYAPPSLAEAADGDEVVETVRPAASAPAEPARVAPAPVASAPAVAPPASAGSWDRDDLARLGVPDVLLRAIDGQRPTDDLGWFAACARAVAPLCRDHEGAVAVVGPHAGRVAKTMEAPMRTLEQRAPRRGSFAIGCKPTDRARGWLDRERRDRALHLVVGGTGWRDWLFEQPTVVSWSAPEHLPAALEVAARFGLVLGGGLDGDEYRPATPVDVAYALRALLEQS